MGGGWGGGGWGGGGVRMHLPLKECCSLVTVFTGLIYVFAGIPTKHLLFYISCIVLRHFFGRIEISILMSGAYWLHLRYYGGDIGHIELHGVESFLVGLSV